MTVREDLEINKLGEIFQCLSNTTRLKIILTLIEGEKNVTEICEIIGMEQSAISHQLKRMKDSNLVKSRKEGRVVHYSLDDEHITMLVTQGLEHVTHIV